MLLTGPANAGLMPLYCEYQSIGQSVPGNLGFWASVNMNGLSAILRPYANATRQYKNIWYAEIMARKLGLLFLVLISAGCASVPSTEFSFGGSRMRLPKDLNAAELEFTLTSGTNVVTFKAKKLSTVNNPAVITSVGDANVAQLEAAGKIGADAFAKGIQAAGKSLVPIP